jgi:hypothetical protein
MHFRPKNKYLLVEGTEEKKPEQPSGFILPDDYKKTETHKVMKLLAASAGSPFIDSVNNYILVPANMVEEVTAFGKKYLLVPEAAVYGIFYR